MRFSFDKNKIRIRALSILNAMVPKKSNRILVYGRRMLNDNSEALLDYMISESYNNKYEIRLCVNQNVDVKKYLGIPNVKIVTNPFLTIWNIFRTMRMFHSHGMTACAVIPCGKQVVFDLWHGSPLKNIGLAAGNKWYPETDSYFLCASPYMAELNRRCFGLNPSQIFIGSNPRNDVLFQVKNKDVVERMKRSRKLIVYMPTFRNSSELNKHESDTDFPIITTENINCINENLKRLNTLLVIKPHPYQNHITLFEKDYSNIIVLKNSDLHKLGLPLYELLGQSDALITDFSSVYFDYLLINKPIGFVVEDMEQYRENRGYTVENPMDLMPGAKIKDQDDFMDFIASVVSNEDRFKEDRAKINHLSNSFVTPDASKRILDFLGIRK